MPRIALIVEFAILFIALPLGYRISPVRFPALPLLWLATAYAWWQLLRDPRFDRAHLWNLGPLTGRLAVGLTLAGGLPFAARYAETGSLATSSFEHALYGCWLFTVGLGQYFYHGTIATVGTVILRKQP